MLNFSLISDLIKWEGGTQKKWLPHPDVYNYIILYKWTNSLKNPTSESQTAILLVEVVELVGEWTSNKFILQKKATKKKTTDKSLTAEQKYNEPMFSILNLLINTQK